jgi:hypothetical protein
VGTVLDLGTYRTTEGDLVHAWYDGDGALMAEREGPRGWTPIDPSAITTAVKLSDDPFWPEGERSMSDPLLVDP